MKILCDTSIIVEYLKGNKRAIDIIDLLFGNEKVRVFLTPFSIEEVFYILAKKKKIKEIKDVIEFINLFELLEINRNVVNEFYKLIEIFNIDTMDLMIISTAKSHKIKYLISIDSDFQEPCEKEGIVLIDSAEKLKEILNK